MTVESWKEIAAKKRVRVFAQIPSKWILEKIPSIEEAPNACTYLDSILPPEQNQITNLTVVELARKIAVGELTAIQVTDAFCQRAAYAHQILNCCTEIFFDKAFETAKRLDEYYQQHGELIGPFHGIPVSLKDQVNLEGLDSSIGYIGLMNKPMGKEDEATLAILLRRAGAVFYVKTTVPMAMMSGDTFSNAYGLTQNAVNRKLSAGGSSGGEGALIGARGSIIGIGSDIGGSIRNPAASQGLFGLRPSHGRIPYQNVLNSCEGQAIIPSVVGPLAHTAEDCEYFLKHLCDLEPWYFDSKVVPLPFKDDICIESKKFRFGVMKWDSCVHPHPPVNRAIEETIKNLEAAGHEVVEWIAQSHWDIRTNATDIFRADGLKEVEDVCALSGEPVSEAISIKDKGQVLNAVSINEHWDQAMVRYRYQKMYFDYWNSLKVDAWILPSSEACSYIPYLQRHKSTYTTIMNCLDVPAITVPVTKVDKAIDTIDKEFVPVSDTDKTVQDLYNPELYHDQPVCLQVATRRFEEEKAIALAKVVFKASNYKA